MLMSQNTEFMIKGAAHVFVAFFSVSHLDFLLINAEDPMRHGDTRKTETVSATFCIFRLLLKTEQFFCLSLLVTHSKYDAAEVQLRVFADDVQSKIGSTLQGFR